jgi:hypothetical protein
MEKDIEIWLSNLKEGDGAAIWRSLVGYQLYDVRKRTPAGKIILSDGLQFDKNGYQIGGGKWNTCRIEPVTERVLLEIKRQKLVSQVQGQITGLTINHINKLDVVALEEIYAVLKKYSPS